MGRRLKAVEWLKKRLWRSAKVEFAL